MDTSGDKDVDLVQCNLCSREIKPAQYTDHVLQELVAS